jgi:hypothetical protein
MLREAAQLGEPLEHEGGIGDRHPGEVQIASFEVGDHGLQCRCVGTLVAPRQRSECRGRPLEGLAAGRHLIGGGGTGRVVPDGQAGERERVRSGRRLGPERERGTRKRSGVLRLPAQDRRLEHPDEPAVAPGRRGLPRLAVALFRHPQVWLGADPVARQEAALGGGVGRDGLGLERAVLLLGHRRYQAPPPPPPNEPPPPPPPEPPLDGDPNAPPRSDAKLAVLNVETYRAGA